MLLESGINVVVCVMSMSDRFTVEDSLGLDVWSDSRQVVNNHKMQC